jgi:hypothetical protein
MAIIGYELALTILTRADFPRNWALTQNNLAGAYMAKITGNRAENIDEAIVVINCFRSLHPAIFPNIGHDSK